MTDERHIIDPIRSVAEKATRGTVSKALVEMNDLGPSFMTALGGPPKPLVIERRDLSPLLDGTDGFSRRCANSKHDYHRREMARLLEQPQEHAHATVIFDGRWKSIRCEGFRSVLFDLETDPQQLVDSGGAEAAEHVAVRRRTEAALHDRTTRRRTRITATPQVLARQSKATEGGIRIGFRDEAEYAAAPGKAFDRRAPVG